MNQKTLNICIPTYNRANQLRNCLVNIYDQLNAQNNLGKVDIFVSDNNSSDETNLVVKEFSANNNNIFYFKNEQNLGFDRNVDAVITKSTGLFAWIISDDEYTEKGSIDLILKLVENNLDVAFVGMCDEYQKVKADYEYFSNGGECLQKLGIFSGGVSRCIYNKKYLPVNRERYYDNYWIHLSMGLEMVATRRMIIVKNLFIPQPTVVPRMEKDGAPFYTTLYLRKIFKGLVCFGYQKTIVNKIANSLSRAMLRNLASAKLYGLHSGWSEFKLLFVNFSDSPFYLIMLTIIFFCPKRIVLLVKKIKDSVV